ncbi:hypothetical protein COT78_02690 [Candidatus Berkelbacteria bacterium CG10_big_fil_rev_8_21_14_0_10_43_13]|uniref:Fibronectin type-III domain-containing protein n=1 Tax=Candidatus Berkelbacteria bacterium CG10_big_fil_rev_8_21_14_0_10_43_13 TaxID=1974514 RepID=A0A2H0W685_9BACT|nr:MAG: hypothetical protein COT78_02690 [Candidatus Berkelbacteria bacterium CG10_big_fil_rev_8_21_14_0_10_43_13]
MYHKWHRHPYHKKVHLTGLTAAFIAIIVGTFSLLFPAGFARATSYIFLQTNWSGGADTVSTANHTSNQSGWTKYYSATDVTAGTELTLTSSAGSATETNDTDFGAGTDSGTASSGSGDSAVVQLAALSGANAWSAMTTTNGPADTAGVGTLTNIGNVIYTHQNNNTSNIYAYDSDAGTWSTQTTTPAATNEGTLSSDGTDIYWYNLVNNTFYKYDISSDSWGDLTACSSCNNSNYAQNLQSIYYQGKIYLYEGTATSLYVYTIATDSWVSVSLPSNAAGVGFNIAPYNGKLYATKVSSDNTTFGYYDLTLETWTTNLAVIPETNDRLGSFLVNAGDYLYFNKGNGTSTFWQYDVAGDSWSAKTDLTALTRAWSGNFVYTNGNIYWMTGVPDSPVLYAYKVEGYESSGNFISQSIDLSGKVIVGNLDFNTTAPSNTEIKFQIAGNNDNATWSFIGPDGTSGTYFTSSGTVIDSSLNGNQYFQYKAFLSTTNPSATSVLSDITINYSQYAASGTLISSSYDSSDPGDVLNQLSWTESLPAGTDVKFQISTAVDDTGSPGVWSDFVGPTSTGDFYTNSAGGETINSAQTDGTNDEWLKYKVFLSTTDTSVTPTLSDLSLQYVLNTAPTVSISNSPTESSAGVYTINYNLSDPEESTASIYLTAGFGAILGGDITSSGTSATLTADDASAYTFLPTGGGTILVGSEMITYTSRSGTALSGLSRAQLSTTAASHSTSDAIYLRVSAGVSGDVGTVATGTGKSISWTLSSDISGIESSSATIKLVANDGNSANQFSSDETSALTMDSKAPTSTSVILNSRTDTLTLAATDGNSVSMKISNSADLSADVNNTDSGNWISYASSKSWSASAAVDRTESIYVSYKDQYGNTAATVSTTTAQNPTNVLIQDTSNSSTSDWRLFISWDVVTTPTEGFNYYQLYRSTDNNNFSTLAQVSNRLTNYYVDTSLDNATTYYYKLTVVDNHVNESNYSTPSSAAAAAAQSGTGLMPNGSGGGDYTGPAISSVAAGTPTTNSVVITWTTDELSNSTVGYSTDTNYATETGVPTMATSHSVTLANLTSNTTYYFRVISYDASNNKTTNTDAETQTFSTAADTTGPTISNINTVVGLTTAGVTWSTTESSNSVVNYGATGSLGSAETSATSVTGHAVTLSGLTSNTTYYFNVSSTDASSNTTTSDTSTFTTASAGTDTADVTAPTISSVTVSDITSSGATITFVSNEDSLGRVLYGVTTDYTYGANEGNNTYTKTKTVVIRGLTADTTYHYLVSASDESGNLNSNTDATFTTLTVRSSDTTFESAQSVINSVADPTLTVSGLGPKISSSGPTVIALSEKSFTVSWTTDTRSTGAVLYRLIGSNDDFATAGDTNYSRAHTVTVENLEPNQNYEYKIQSADVAGNMTSSSLYDVTMLTGTISSVSVNNIETTKVSISWNTASLSTGIVEYNSDLSTKPLSVADNNLGRTHTVALSNLSDDSRYSFNIVMRTEKGDTVRSGSYNFSTSADGNTPVISKVENRSALVSGSQDKVQTVITWQTNKPADSQVVYAENSLSSKTVISTPLSSDLVKNHTVVLVDLKPSTVYQYYLLSNDKAGNVAKSDKYMLLTPTRNASIFDLILGGLKQAFSWTKNL